MAKMAEFSVEEKLNSLIRLQKIESKLDQLQVLKGELPMEVNDLEDEIAGLHSREQRIEEEINGINDYIAGKKDLILDTQTLIKKYEKQSENVKNSREFDAINKELEMAHLDEKLHEKHIKNATEEIAIKVTALEAARKTIETKEGNLALKKGELEKIISETEKEEKDFSKEIDGARSDVEDRLLLSYDRIRKNYRNGLAVVPIERDSCGGCYHAIPPQKQSEIRLRKKIMVCENCGRILVDSDLFNTIDIGS